MIAALKSSVFEGVYVQDKTVHPFNLWIVVYAATQSAHRALHHNERVRAVLLCVFYRLLELVSCVQTL